ncbi:hypothetical protein CLV97_12456 [Planifilum fimeticola]|uniref:Uncharacterized protein n=1 Tax=Planifilum fimeticola TaxID=201975 RepID=A0A2T0LC15_9BACL|nr:hypothetical protein [Planifilum fimeticola]PRX39518.1 hypothetical protein CLV97_12456 [Planifilum fimeticola]
MKKYRVTSEFIDKNTRVYYPTGSTYETDDAERVEELRKKGFIGGEINQQTAEKPKGKTKKGKGDADQ